MPFIRSALVTLLVGYSAWMTIRCWGYPPEFTDVIGQQSSPDGSIVASYVVEAHGPLADGPTYGLTVMDKGDDPLRASPILIDDGHARDINYRWLSNNRLEVELPCGWWSGLTNGWQSPASHRMLNIVYTGPRAECSSTLDHPSPEP